MPSAIRRCNVLLAGKLEHPICRVPAKLLHMLGEVQSRDRALEREIREAAHLAVRTCLPPIVYRTPWSSYTTSSVRISSPPSPAFE